MFEMFVCSLELFASRRGRPERRGSVRREHRELCSPKFVCSPKWFAMFARSGVVRHSPVSQRLTLGADKAYDVFEFVDDLRDLDVTPHITQNTTNRSSAIDVRTTCHPGYAISQPKRKRTEEPCGGARPSAGSLGRRCAAPRADASSSL
jgi:hypothetical protein